MGNQLKIMRHAHVQQRCRVPIGLRSKTGSMVTWTDDELVAFVFKHVPDTQRITISQLSVEWPRTDIAMTLGVIEDNFAPFTIDRTRRCKSNNPPTTQTHMQGLLDDVFDDVSPIDMRGGHPHDTRTEYVVCTNTNQKKTTHTNATQFSKHN